MSTLFESYYDCLGHELSIGSPVLGFTSGMKIYGHVINFLRDKKGNDKFEVVPDIGYKSDKEVKLKKSYKISYRNICLIKIHKNK